MTDPEELRERATSIFRQLREHPESVVTEDGLDGDESEGTANSETATTPSTASGTDNPDGGPGVTTPGSTTDAVAPTGSPSPGGVDGNFTAHEPTAEDHLRPTDVSRTTDDSNDSATTDDILTRAHSGTGDAGTADADLRADDQHSPQTDDDNGRAVVADLDPAAHPGGLIAGPPPPPPVILPSSTISIPSTPLTTGPNPIPGQHGHLGPVDSIAFELTGAERAALAPERERSPGPPHHPGSEHALPRILAIANQKGGVGKTTTAVNLGASLAELGYRVLIVDLDPQGNATTGLGVNPRNLDTSVYDVILHDVPVEDAIEPTSVRNLFVVPATIDLAGAEIEFVPAFSRELRLKRAIDAIQDDFDFVLIDCPPSLGLLTVNGLAAASEVVVPIQCEYYALEGLGQLLRNVNLVKANLNPRLEVSTIILTMYDARTRLAEQVVDEVRTHFGDRVCRNIVPRTVRLSEAPSFGQPIIVFDSSSRGAIAYRELAKEVSGGAPQRIR